MKKDSYLHFFTLVTVMALLLGACAPQSVPAPLLPSGTLPATATQPPLPKASMTPPPASTRTSVPSPVPSLVPTESPTSALPAIRRVLIISFDGLRPDAISAAPMPILQGMLQTSAWSLTAQTIFPSVTLPAHTSMLTGLCPAKHGVDWNDYLPGKGFAKGPSLFDVAHAAGLKTVMFVGKEKLVQVTDPASVDVFRYINDRDVVIAQRIGEEFPVDFGVMFVHFATPDAMGHAYGWMSPQYLSVVRRADEALGSILQDLDAHGLRNDTLIIMTADHGGHAQTHGSRMPEDMTIPWIISGPGVKPGPLTTPIQTTDTAATAAWALGLSRSAEWDGWPVFEAFGQMGDPRPEPFCK